MIMTYTASALIKIAEAEVGYLEKKSNSNLDSKTTNAGYNNYTKYARDLNKAGYYNGNKNGYAWCDVFVDWLFFQLCGKDAKKAEHIICQTGDYGAGCVFSARYYRNAGRFYSSPKPGDQIFFGKKGDESHTGIVYKVDSSKVYTIEGNTSGASGVVANGGGVFKKSYSRSYSKIVGYGRPRYDAESKTETTTTPATKDKKIDSVLEVQIWLNNNYSTGLTPDGLYGSRTKAALVKALQKELGFTGKDIDGDYGKKTNAAVKKHNLCKGDKGNLVKVLQGLLVCNGYKGAYVDGSFGNGTETAVEQYQRKRGLKDDGVAGSKTFTALCA